MNKANRCTPKPNSSIILEDQAGSKAPKFKVRTLLIVHYRIWMYPCLEFFTPSTF